MSRTETHEITRLLSEWAKGNPKALEELTPLIYCELQRLAASYLRKEPQAHTLQPTALVHEAFLRLVGQCSPSWQNRSHFYGIAARLMRQVLVDHARRKNAHKRGGSKMTVSLEGMTRFQPEKGPGIISLDDSLKALEKIDPRKCKAVELHYFGGLGLEEIAEALGVSLITVRRDLKMAEAWLHNQLQRD